MKKVKLGNNIIRIAFIAFLIQNFYFGWNMTPESELELITDRIIQITFFVGFVIYLMPLFEIYENFVRRNL